MVETTVAAQACVELLRREKLGVATFMILVLIVILIFYHVDMLTELGVGILMTRLFSYK